MTLDEAYNEIWWLVLMNKTVVGMMHVATSEEKTEDAWQKSHRMVMTPTGR